MRLRPLDRVLAAYASGDLARAAAGFAPDAVYREARKQPVRGRQAIAAHFERFAARGARWSFALDEVIADGDRACVVYRFGLSGGPGEPLRERAGCATVRLDGSGLIAEWREYEG